LYIDYWVLKCILIEISHLTRHLYFFNTSQIESWKAKHFSFLCLFYIITPNLKNFSIQINHTQGKKQWKLVQKRESQMSWPQLWCRDNIPRSNAFASLNLPIYQTLPKLLVFAKRNCNLCGIMSTLKDQIPGTTFFLPPKFMNLMFGTSTSIFVPWRWLCFFFFKINKFLIFVKTYQFSFLILWGVWILSLFVSWYADKEKTNG